MVMNRPGNGDLLSGWKEVAGHLGVSTRTAQKWEKERCLPIHRGGVEADRAPITASVFELDAWRLAQIEGMEQSERHRASWLLAVAALLAILLGFLLHWWLQPAPNPAMLTRRGELLQVFDKDRQLLFERVLPEMATRREEGLQAKSDPLDSGSQFLITSIDNDPENEVILEVHRKSQLGRSNPVAAFDNDGSELWSVSLDLEVWAAGRRFFNFNGKPILLSNGLLVVVAHQNPFFPSQVALLDPGSGEILDRYFHPGYMATILSKDVDGDAREELVFGGVNNPGDGPGRPVIGVLKAPFRHGAVVEGDYFQNRVRLEKYLVFELAEWKGTYGEVSKAIIEELSDGSLRVITNGPFPLEFTFDASLEPESFRLSEAAADRHAELTEEGILDHSLDEDEIRRLSRVLYLDHAPDCNSREFNELFEANAVPVYRVPEELRVSGPAE